MKKFFLTLFIFLFFITAVYAGNFDEVGLTDYRIEKISTPKIYNYEKKYNINPELEDIEYESTYSDEDVFESKAGKAFTKFINNKVINNKINNYTSKIAK